MSKKELQVAAIENGTVIDHIPADKTYQVVKLLRLEEISTPVTIGYNLPSSKMGRKGIIKSDVRKQPSLDHSAKAYGSRQG